MGAHVVWCGRCRCDVCLYPGHLVCSETGVSGERAGVHGLRRQVAAVPPWMFWTEIETDALMSPAGGNRASRSASAPQPDMDGLGSSARSGCHDPSDQPPTRPAHTAKLGELPQQEGRWDAGPRYRGDVDGRCASVQPCAGPDDCEGEPRHHRDPDRHLRGSGLECGVGLLGCLHPPREVGDLQGDPGPGGHP